MNVIVLNDYGFINGGAAQVAISSLSALADLGCNVTFASSVGPVSTEIDNQKIKIVNFGHHDLIGNPSKFSAALHGIWDRRCASQIGELLDEYDRRNTIIHLHSWVKSLSSSVVREAAKRSFKIVATLHDYFSVCPNGGLYDYQKMHACSLNPMSAACILTNCDSRNYAHKLWRVSRQFIQRKMGKLPDNLSGYIVISNYSEELLRQHLPNKIPIYRINNPIDVEKTHPAKPDKNENFTFIGRLSPEKGALLFASAALDAGVRTVFVGNGPDEPKIKDINPAAIFLGWQDRHGVFDAISKSRSIVFPSLLHETQGLVVSEAAALGIPSIVGNQCAARDAIINGKTGLLFETNNTEDLASKLRILSENAEYASQLGRSAYNLYWANPFTIERHARDLLTCYQQVLYS